MFIKRTRSGSREYIQLVEAYRDEAGKAKQRTLATLGRVEDLQGSVDSVIVGLLKVTGHDPMMLAPPKAASVRFEPARALGDVWALTHLWKELGFHDLRRMFRRTRHRIDIEALIRIMVFNRLCDPESKLGVRCHARAASAWLVPGRDQPSTRKPAQPRVPLGGTEPKVAHGHHRVSHPCRQGIPVPDHRLLRWSRRQLDGRYQPGR